MPSSSSSLLVPMVKEKERVRDLPASVWQNPDNALSDKIKRVHFRTFYFDSADTLS